MGYELRIYNEYVWSVNGGQRNPSRRTGVRVVVAGGSGVIGRLLVRELIRAGHEAAVVTRDPERARLALPVAANVVAWQPGGTDTSWTSWLVGASAVVDLTAAGAIAARPRGRVARDRLTAVTALVDGLASVPPSERPGVLVSASSAAVYAATGAPAIESSPLSDTPAARQLRLLEAAATEAEELDVRVAVLRIGRLARPAPVAGGRSNGAWVSLDDLVAVIGRVMTGWDLCGPVNVVVPDACPDAEGPAVWPAKLLAAGFAFAAAGTGACASDAVPRRAARHADFAPRLF